jgi:peptide/nickel transport system substrate-binding protein
MTKGPCRLVWHGVFLTVFAGCSSDSVPPGGRGAGEAARTPEAAAGAIDTLIVSSWADEYLFGPYWGSAARAMMFEPLFRQTGPAQWEGALVTRWEPSEDFRTWTYHLRSDVRWHDGVPLTAHDVKFSLDIRAHPDVLDRTVPGSRTVRVVDDTTFQITYNVLDNPTAELSIWPRHLLEDLDPKAYWEWDFWSEPVGSGPYRYVRHVDRQLMEVEANPDYYRGAAPIERVIFKFGGNSLVELLAGNVDAAEQGPATGDSDVALARNPDFRIYYRTTPSSSIALYWNHRNPILRDAAVRRALTLAIDRREIARVLGFPDETPVVDVVLPFFPDGFDAGEALPYDTDEARVLLESAGWTDGDGNGVLEREGREFRFTAAVLGGGDWNLEAVAVYVQAALARVGVRMEIRPMTRDALRNAIETDAADAAVQRFHYGNLTEVLTGESRFGYDDPELRNLLEAADTEWDPDARRPILADVLQRFRERLPVTPLVPLVSASIAHRRVHGLHSPDRTDFSGFINELWIEGRQ